MVSSMMVPSPTSKALRRSCCSACDNEGHDGCKRMKKNVAHGGCKRMEKKVAHGVCGSCFTHKGRRRRIWLGVGNWVHITLKVF